MSNRILMAQVGSAHGIQGEVRLKAFGDDPLALTDFGTLVSDDGQTYRITSLRPAKGQMLVARFKGIGDRTAAEALNGTKLYVDRDQLPDPEEDEFYQTDLIGCRAIDETGEIVGTVLAVPNFGAGDLLDLELSDGSTLLVPFSEDYVPEIDIARRIVTVASLEKFQTTDEAEDDEPEQGDASPES